VELSVTCYDVTRRFPKEELFGLVSQMRRAAISIASNIAEGAARDGSKEFVKFLYISLGSASELDTQIEIAKWIGLDETSDLERLQLQTNKVSRMVQGLIHSVKKRSGQ
jgi:four helix bundle protein